MLSEAPVSKILAREAGAHQAAVCGALSPWWLQEHLDRGVSRKAETCVLRSASCLYMHQDLEAKLSCPAPVPQLEAQTGSQQNRSLSSSQGLTRLGHPSFLDPHCPDKVKGAPGPPAIYYQPNQPIHAPCTHTTRPSTCPSVCVSSHLLTRPPRAACHQYLGPGLCCSPVESRPLLSPP